ncbi:carboxypeptidase-like regulatory domain-containing protein [Haladaptatus cibarius]|uniref:carboxypeptidase-like regulatory domain-containing protein n=1 Tax=Haladaptatus cibarius TaxID=453847 RepID=UPI000679BE06|nr:carboxypeptidase-like regulatory domain-containing protein [Haladaptatus cibarius]
MNCLRHTVSVAIVVALIVTSSAIVIGQTTTTSEQATDSPASGSVETTPNGTVPRHQNPEQVRRDGNTDAVERWLEARLARRLGDSAVHLKRGQYEQARSIVGGDYSRQLGQYVEIQQSMRTNDSDNSTEQFQQGVKSQRTFAESVQEYRQTYKKYQRARRNGNIERARQHARKLDRLSARTNQSASSVKSTYRNVSQTTSVNLSQQSQQVTSISQNVSQTQTTVEDEVFQRTSLNVSTSSRNASFLDPVQLSGTLTAANGSAVANRNVTLMVENQTIRTRTSFDGRFRTTYRPTTLPVNTSRVTVEYRPSNTSAYLGANDTVNLNVTQVTPNVTLTRTPNRTAFDRRFVVSGTVSADDIEAWNVPVAVSLGGEQIGTTTTGANGSFSLQTRLPMSVQSGQQQLRATVPLSGRALASANESTTVTVERTNASLSVNATRNESRVETSGRLTTRNGTAVAQRTVVFRVNGTRVAETTTGKNGSYATTFELPSSVADSESATVTAVYEPSGSNLGAARASDVVEGMSSHQRLLDWISVPWTGGVLFVFVVLVGLIFGRSRRTDAVSDVDDATDADDERDPDERVKPVEADAEFDAETNLLDTARTHLSMDEYASAVEAGYVAFRQYLDRQYGLTQSATPREFRDSAESEISDREYRILSDLTACYEHVAFASRPISAAAVSDLLAVVEENMIDEEMTDLGNATDESDGEGSRD